MSASCHCFPILKTISLSDNTENDNDGLNLWVSMKQTCNLYITLTLSCLCFRPDEFKFGCTSLRVPPELLYQLRNDITVSPNGVAFVKVSRPNPALWWPLTSNSHVSCRSPHPECEPSLRLFLQSHEQWVSTQRNKCVCRKLTPCSASFHSVFSFIQSSLHTLWLQSTLWLCNTNTGSHTYTGSHSLTLAHSLSVLTPVCFEVI